MKPGTLWIALIAMAAIASCKKEKNSSVMTPPTDSTRIPDDKIKDTAISFSRDIYLWNTQIPDTFKTQDYSDPNAIMVGIRK